MSLRGGGSDDVIRGYMLEDLLRCEVLAPPLGTSRGT